MSLLEMLFE